MDILSILIGAALAALLVVFVSRPLWKARRAAQAESQWDTLQALSAIEPLWSREAAQAESQLDTLQARYESLLTQIREQDFDHATGKVADEDHASLREPLVGEAAGVLRQIDALFEAMPGARVETREDEIERAVAARRQSKLAATASTGADLEAAIEARRKRKPAPATMDDEIEAAIAARRQALSCPACGKPIQASDAFCPRCGAPLGTQVAR